MRIIFQYSAKKKDLTAKNKCMIEFMKKINNNNVGIANYDITDIKDFKLFNLNLLRMNKKRKKCYIC